MSTLIDAHPDDTARKISMCKIYLKYITYFTYKYEIYSRKYILHTSSYPVYIFLPLFHDEKLYVSHIYFFPCRIIPHTIIFWSLLFLTLPLIRLFINILLDFLIVLIYRTSSRMFVVMEDVLIERDEARG